ncbi:hypothetical protein [Clostridium perfringens]|uniref:hypothetical protein n=1 Tax=Clostridium perfringens TaxID=1502 RepID=UPI001CC92055|nr:hypothetical protein [Clostridium perfringens]UBK36159.1 hypothetical protein KLF25_07110 [Clostridium perfringens]
MEDFLKEIELALKHKLYFIALSSTLTLPDICGALGSENNKASGEKYKEWYDKYAFNKCSTRLDGHSCYKFRCSLLHQGSTIDSSYKNKSNFSRILFLEPYGNNFFHDNVINGALNLDINQFCLGMINAVKNWNDEVKDSDVFKKNYPNMIKRYQNGLSPFISGITVIS